MNRIIGKFLILLILFVNSLTSLNGQQLSEKLVKEVEESVQQAKKFEAESDFNQAAFFYNRAATVYWVNGFPDNAIKYFLLSVEMNKKIGNLNALRTLYNNIGMVYTDEEDYPKALEYFNKTLDVSRQMNRKPDIASALINLSNALSESKQYSAAAKALEEANAIARELNDEKLLRNSYSLMADVYEKMGNSEKSAEYFSLYTAIMRKITRDEVRKKDAEARQLVDEAKSKVSDIEKAKQETERELQDKQKALRETEESLEHVQQLTQEQQMQIDLLNTQTQLQEAVIRNQKLMRNVFIVVILGVVAFASMIFYSLREKKKANALLSKQNKEIVEQKTLIELKNKALESAFERIEKQNNDITSSINYAQRIQQAMLPEPGKLSDVIPDSFVLLQPRDIVSGDFYWYQGYGSPQALKGKKLKNFIKLHNLCDDDLGFLISAVDCTGHGVPGAFMSMIGFNLLETITHNGTVLPNEMLNELHRSIRYLLKQYNTENRDGMDMVICSIKDRGRKVLFSGAKNPIYYIKNGELVHLKGDSIPVGGRQKEDVREFTLHTIEVDSPTAFYIFSDGYIDQFGGELGRKFTSVQFKNLLIENYQLPMLQQKDILIKSMQEWKGDGKQIDDMLVIGFRLGVDDINV